MNVKDLISTICGVLIAILGAIVTAGQSGLVLPAWVTPVCIAGSTVCAAIVMYLTGKNPNLTTKTPLQVDQLNNAK